MHKILLLFNILCCFLTGCSSLTINSPFIGPYKAQNGLIYWVDEKCYMFYSHKDTFNEEILCYDRNNNFTEKRYPMTIEEMTLYVQEQQLATLKQIQMQQAIATTASAYSGKYSDLSYLLVNLLYGFLL